MADTRPQFRKRRHRPLDHLAAAGELYPSAWRQADEFRADRGRDGLPNWPDWRYLPMAGWYAIVSGGGDNRVPINQAGDVGRLAALGAWRVTQGIYRFDPGLLDAVAATPVDCAMSADMLYRLPEWCVYVETPGFPDPYSGICPPPIGASARQLHGFFAHLEWDANTGRPELRLLLDCEDSLTPIPIHLGPWSLAESIARMTDIASIQAMSAGMGAAPAGTGGIVRSWVEPLVSILLYLCSDQADISDGIRRPATPTPKRTKSGWMMFPPDKPTIWNVSTRK